MNCIKLSLIDVNYYIRNIRYKTHIESNLYKNNKSTITVRHVSPLITRISITVLLFYCYTIMNKRYLPVWHIRKTSDRKSRVLVCLIKIELKKIKKGEHISAFHVHYFSLFPGCRQYRAYSGGMYGKGTGGSPWREKWEPG